MEKIEIKDYKLLTPISIDLNIDGKDLTIFGQLDYANKEVFLDAEFQDMGIEEKFLQYLREINSLPSNFYAVSRPPVPKEEDFDKGENYE